MANIVWASFYCASKGYNFRHSIGDLIWDIIELKTGKSQSSEQQIEKFAKILGAVELKWKGKEEHGCEELYKSYGEGAARIPDLMYKR